MSIPFYHVVRPDPGEPFLATRSGLRFRTAQQGALLLATLDELFVGGRPIKPWPPFLDGPEVLRQERRELVACLVELGWRR